MASPFHLLPFLLFLATSFSMHAPAVTSSPAGGHNITNILSGFPEYSEYNSYLTRTRVSDEINSRETLTVLVLPNPAMRSLASNHPLSAVKNALRLLTLLDYYDATKLHSISKGTVEVTTLLQATGEFQGTLGFVNITNLRGGKVGFGSTAPDAKLDSTYTKSVKQFPYSISVLEISGPVVFPGLLDAPESANLTALLVKAGCKTFSSLIESSGVLKMYQAAAEKGVTVFAPNDEAFTKVGEAFAGAPTDVTTLSQAELVTLLQYHAIPQYSPRATLKNAKGRFPTLATGAGGKFDIGVITRGDDVTLDAGLDTSRVASTVIDDPPLVVLTVDSVLLPEELFSRAPAPAPVGSAASGNDSASPTGGPAAGPAASGAVGKKAPKKKAHSPAPLASAPHHHSPPTPPAEGSADSPAPADGPASDDVVADDTTPNEAAGLVSGRRRSLVAAAAAGSFLQLLLL